VPSAIDAAYRSAEQQLAAGKHREAAGTLAPLLAAYPAHAELRVLECRIALARGGPRDPAATATCDRAAALGEIGPAIEVAGARLAAGDAAGARATLLAAEPRIEGLPPARGATAWLTLAMQYQKLDAVSWAEAALARSRVSAGTDPGITAWAAMMRARYGVPRDGARWKLQPDNEADAIAAVKGVLALVNDHSFDAARRAADAAEKRWPALPGLLAARCDLELRRGAVAAARRQCGHAIEQGPSSWALYLLGSLELESKRPTAFADGTARLREAIELDPELAQAWRTLAKALARANAVAEWQELRRGYEKRFNATLP
jgi:predicted Zn-dependent protease